MEVLCLRHVNGARYVILSSGAVNDVAPGECSFRRFVPKRYQPCSIFLAAWERQSPCPDSIAQAPAASKKASGTSVAEKGLKHDAALD